MLPFSTPVQCLRIKRVASFHELTLTPLAGGVNALCWERSLPGDFSEVVERLESDHGLELGITPLDPDYLGVISRSPACSDAGRKAIEAMLADHERLRRHAVDPELNAVNGFLREANPGPVRTDVSSFHVDSATTEADTWLCTYHGAPSEGLRNEEAMRKVDVPEIRLELLKLYGEASGSGAFPADDECFREWLTENCYDLHYAPIAGARPFSFGVGNLWRIATQYHGCLVPPCIHRAPEVEVGDGVRLLLIG